MKNVLIIKKNSIKLGTTDGKNSLN